MYQKENGKVEKTFVLIAVVLCHCFDLLYIRGIAVSNLDKGSYNFKINVTLQLDYYYLHLQSTNISSFGNSELSVKIQSHMQQF